MRKRRRRSYKPISDLERWRRTRWEVKGALSSMRSRLQGLRGRNYLSAIETTTISTISLQLEALLRSFDDCSQDLRP